jgi:Putative Ig domain
MKSRNSPRILWLLAVAELLSACGGGGGGGSNSGVAPLPASISYPAQLTVVANASIPVLRPLVSGRVSGFTVAPPLPVGITLEPNIGTIFGTPTAVTPATTYTVSAASADGIVSSRISLTVNDQAPSLSYSPSSWTLLKGVPLPEIIMPAVKGGTVVTWSIDRALPAGLNFDMNNGQISGTPSEVSSQAGYIVTASNSGGTSSTTLTITVQEPSSSIRRHLAAEATALHDGQRILALDVTGHGVLWNAQTGTTLATLDDVVDSYGRVTCATNNLVCLELLGLAGQTAVAQSGNWLLVLDSGSGARLAQIEVPAAIRWWRLAHDGSYVVAATDTQLTAWSPAGAVLFTRTANYSSAKAFAAAGELRIGLGPAGANVIETIAVPAGVARTSAPHQGSFQSWLDDGEEFIASTGDTVWIYPLPGRGESASR